MRRQLTIKHAAEIYRAHRGDETMYTQVTVQEIQDYKSAETFEEFLRINQIDPYERCPK